MSKNELTKSVPHKSRRDLKKKKKRKVLNEFYRMFSKICIYDWKKLHLYLEREEAFILKTLVEYGILDNLGNPTEKAKKSGFVSMSGSFNVYKFYKFFKFYRNKSGSSLKGGEDVKKKKNPG